MWNYFNVIFVCVFVGEVMKSLNSPQDFWQVEMVNTEMQIHKLQEELERVTLENSRLLEKSTVRGGGCDKGEQESIKKCL